MFHWKKNLLLTLATCIYFISQSHSIFAQVPFFSDSCVLQPCTLQGLKLGGGAIWLKPCMDDLDFGYVFESSGTRHKIDYKAICPEWSLGFEVFGSYQNYCYPEWTLKTSWTHFRVEDSHKIVANADENASSPLLDRQLIVELGENSTGQFKRVKGGLDLVYNDWDLLLSYDLCSTPCMQVSPSFGLAGMFLEQKQKVSLSNPANVNNGDMAWVKWKSDYHAFGFKGGTFVRFFVRQCLSFYASGEGTLLAGDVDSKNKQRIVYHTPGTVTSRIELKDDKNCHFVTGYRAAMGFLYDFGVNQTFFTFKIGYEFADWFNLPNPRIYFGNSTSLESAKATSSVTRNLGYHGVVGSLSIIF